MAHRAPLNPGQNTSSDPPHTARSSTGVGSTVTLHVTVNGVDRTVTAPPIKRLLDILREDLALTGTKEGCGEGECGSCSVLVDGDLVNACLIPFLQVEGARIVTIEGLGTPAHLHPIQACFLAEGGAQCGICTPGMILATHHLLELHPQPTLLQTQEGLSGNLCRCTGYTRIVEAVGKAALVFPPAALNSPPAALDPPPANLDPRSAR